MPLRRAVPLACALLLSTRADAQAPLAPSPTNACVDAIPDSSLVSTPVYLEAQANGTAARLLLPAADLLTQEIATRTRARLGAPGGMLPPSGPEITWRSRGWSLTLVAHRDGRLAWWRTPPSRDDVDRYGILTAEVAARGDTSPPVALLAHVLEELRASGEAFIAPWPDSLHADSVTFQLTLRFGPRDATDRLAYHGQPLRMGFLVFSLAVPRMVPVRVARSRARLEYPDSARATSTTGTILLQYVVDTTGRVDTTTVRDLWPDDAPPLTAEQRPHYDAFVAAARRMLPDARFTPARLGGCVVRQLVQQPFVFKLGRSPAVIWLPID